MSAGLPRNISMEAHKSAAIFHFIAGLGAADDMAYRAGASGERVRAIKNAAGRFYAASRGRRHAGYRTTATAKARAEAADASH